MNRSDTDLTGRLAEYARLAGRLRRVQDGITDVRATADSDDGLVHAVVGGRGELLELELDQRIFREQDAATLARKIVETVRDAAAEAERDAAGIAEKLMPQQKPGAAADSMFGPVLSMLDEGPQTWSRR
ncbi:YbaB/EbfC family nucleoid-associated protein [Lentzea cavernae]|uniref:Uncharacterized protein n=1 Tax=Lentzea cavernae TaxID=2020703 RepID=A0ABQ3MHP4_9PSEU|nr:YbaB/EbfC family nucleoid-associated protein [Lentzea cavernae]GHH44123.1 hypothetical protein GCM10017774_43140 [Lentzea cavernae]